MMLSALGKGDTRVARSALRIDPPGVEEVQSQLRLLILPGVAAVGRRRALGIARLPPRSIAQDPRVRRPRVVDRQRRAPQVVAEQVVMPMRKAWWLPSSSWLTRCACATCPMGRARSSSPVTSGHDPGCGRYHHSFPRSRPPGGLRRVRGQGAC
jgi:hypothetical protein